MKLKSALAFMMAAGMMAPQTVVNPNTGQTTQQQMIAEKRPTAARKRRQRASVKSNGRLGNPFVEHNQRQRRKRWRQAPHRRLKASRRAA
ncbi:MAG TPA: hypothetical protein VFX43_17755 [Chitinophagaceae bacterium]|nr:hypothetical protein [Chitinophagaceae bacterium]